MARKTVDVVALQTYRRVVKVGRQNAPDILGNAGIIDVTTMTETERARLSENAPVYRRLSVENYDAGDSVIWRIETGHVVAGIDAMTALQSNRTDGTFLLGINVGSELSTDEPEPTFL